MGTLGGYGWIRVSMDGFGCHSGYVHTLCRFGCVQMDSGDYGWIRVTTDGFGLVE
jgi:hypothetical protein